MQRTSHATSHLWIESPDDRELGQRGAKFNEMFNTHPPLRERINLLRRIEGLEASTEPDPEAPGGTTAVTGEPPSPINPPSGCRFHPRCTYADSQCETDEPQLRSMGEGHIVACHHPVETAVTVGAPPVVRLITQFDRCLIILRNGAKASGL